MTRTELSFPELVRPILAQLAASPWRLSARDACIRLAHWDPLCFGHFLSWMENDGLIDHVTENGKKLWAITDKGRERLKEGGDDGAA